MSELTAWIAQPLPLDTAVFAELHIPPVWNHIRVRLHDRTSFHRPPSRYDKPYKQLHVGECAQWSWDQWLNISHIDSVLHGVEVEGCEFYDPDSEGKQKGGYGTRLMQLFDQLNSAIGVNSCSLVDGAEKTFCGCDTYSFAEIRRLLNGQSWYNAYAFLPSWYGDTKDLDKELADFNKRFRQAQALLQQPAAPLIDELRRQVEQARQAYEAARSAAGQVQSISDPEVLVDYDEMELHKLHRSYVIRAQALRYVQPILAQGTITYQQFFQQLIGGMFANEGAACKTFEVLRAVLKEPFASMRRIWRDTPLTCTKYYKDARGVPLQWEFRKSDNGLFVLVHRAIRP